MRPVSRRVFLGSGAAIGFMSAIGVAGRSRVAAARAPLSVEVADNAVAAIVAAVGGAGVTVTTKAGGEIGHILVDGTSHAALGKVVLKGSGAARARFLDDPRNAPGFGAAVRDVLKALDPAGAAGYDERHKAWSRPFARQVLKWTTRLKTSPVAGKTVSDPHGRIYLLEWAGAKVSAKAPASAPAALASAPAGPAKGTLAAYTAYIEKLVAAVA
jgi:hypothetical protein